MKNTLGESSAQAILFHLGLLQYVKKPREFHDNLCYLLKGTQPAITIERMIVKELYGKVGRPFLESGKFDFEEQIRMVKEGMSWKGGGLKGEQ